MAVSLRGQLGVKSSPLSPTSSKLTTQMLVISHMDNHYRKISKAKSAIDNGTPKSMMSSQKLRDRQVQKHVERYGSRPTSRSTYRPGSAQDIYDEQQWEEPEDEEERQVRDIMRTTLRVPLRSDRGMDSVHATAGSKSESAGGFGMTTMRPKSARCVRGVMQAVRGVTSWGQHRPASARSTTSLASNGTMTSRSSNPLKVTYDGDVLTKHAHSFTEPHKPFTPRTLKTNRQSSLKRYKYYTPPPGKAHHSDRAAEEPGLYEDRRATEPPQAKPRRKSSQGGGGGDLGRTKTLTETMLMDMSLQSHAPRGGSEVRGQGGEVPRLDISMDKDHLNWMQEQATRAHIRTHNSNHHPSGSLDGGDTLGHTGTLGQSGTPGHTGTMEQTGTLGQTDTLRFTRTASTSKSFGIKSPTSHRLNQAEEEQKYVNFAHEVTQDIVSRSISSDRVLQKVFENHIERKKGELDERRLRAIITDIRRDLGVQHVEPLEPKTVQYSHNLEHTHSLHAEPTAMDSLQGQTAATMDTLDSMDTTTTSANNNTYNFERTTDMLSTIHSQRDDDDDLSATAALRQYQMTLTVKADAEDDNSLTSEGRDRTLTPDKGGTTQGSTLANGDMETESGDSDRTGGGRRVGGEQQHHPPSPRPRALPRHTTTTTTTASPHTLSRQASGTDTDARTDMEEEYEDDYDADEDDNQERGSEDEF
ncbi:hypothetical protein ACOMHN_038095 [Nucella lapillus]